MPSSDINFIPSATPQAPTVKDQIFQWVIKNGKRIVIVTQAIVLLVFISRFKFDTDIRNITTEVEENQAIVENLAEVEDQYLENQKKLGLVKPIIERQTNWEERLNSFNKKIPNDLILENVKFAQNEINLSARTKSPQSFQVFISSLLKDQSIKTAVLESSRFDSETKEYSFIISLEVAQ